MPDKRRNTSSPECDSPPPEKRRAQTTKQQASSYDGIYNDADEEVDVSERPQVHPSTGQSGAFPGLSGEDELFYGPANDGIDYLRMVRSEAKGIPQLLRAQAEADAQAEEGDQEEDGDDDGGYWDDDGTYTAKPLVHTTAPTSTLPKAQIEYYDSLLTQFALVRATMKCVPPLSAIEKLTSSQPISFPIENRSAYTAWWVCVRTRDPSPVQIACMDEGSVFELIRLITEKMRGLLQHDDVESAKRFGAWSWAVLGRCPERGELGGEEISELRMFAVKAVDTRGWLEGKMQRRERGVEGGGEDVDMHGGNEDDIADITDEIEAAKDRLAQQGASGQAKQNGEGSHDQDNNPAATAENAEKATEEKFVALDMILTVVGEVYGQRDLLESRRVWQAQ